MEHCSRQLAVWSNFHRQKFQSLKNWWENLLVLQKLYFKFPAKSFKNLFLFYYAMLILVGACYDGVFAPRVFWGEGVHLKLLSFLLVSFFFFYGEFGERGWRSEV